MANSILIVDDEQGIREALSSILADEGYESLAVSSGEECLSLLEERFDCIAFDNELSPAQQRAWEEESGLCVIDRQEVILDIFNLRARTSEGRARAVANGVKLGRAIYMT